MIWLFWLYVAHFIGDYPLQTNWVYHYKLKNPLGGVFHAIGIGFALALCFMPLWNHIEVWVAIGTIVMAHYLQDEVKVSSPVLQRHPLVGYILDQAMHLIFSALVWFVLLKPAKLYPEFMGELYQNIYVPLYLLGLIIVTYVWETSRFIVKSKKNEEFIKRWGSMLIRGLVYSLIFGTVIWYLG